MLSEEKGMGKTREAECMGAAHTTQIHRPIPVPVVLCRRAM